MGDVEGRERAVFARDGWKVRAGERGEIQHVINGLAPGVVGLELQAVGKAPGQRDRTCVIDGSAARAVRSEGLKLRLLGQSYRYKRVVGRIGLQNRAEQR